MTFALETPVTDRKRLHDEANSQARVTDASMRQPDFMDPVETQEGPCEGEGQKRARLVLSAAEVRKADGAKQRYDQEMQAVDRVMEAALFENRIDEVGT